MPTPHNAQYVAGHIRCGKSIRCVRRGGDWKRKHGRDAVTPRNRKGEATGNTNCDLNRRASLRPYRGEATNRVLLGRKSPGCPAGVFAAVDLGGEQTWRPEHNEISATSKIPPRT